MKKIFAILLAVGMLAIFATPVFAAAPEPVQPLYNGLETIKATLIIDESTGLVRCSGSVDSQYQVPVEVLLQLQVYKNGSWQTLRSWSDTGTGDAYTSGSYTVESGYNYRAFVTGYICNDLWLPVESATVSKEVYYPSN